MHVTGEGIWFILHKPREPDIFILEEQKKALAVIPVVSHYKTNLNCRKQADVGLSEVTVDDSGIPTQVHLSIWKESQLPDRFWFS